MDTHKLLWSLTAGAVAAVAILAGLWWADSELGLLRSPASAPETGAFVRLAEPVVTRTADGNGHAVRARVAALLESGADSAAEPGGYAERVLERATRVTLATSTTGALARPDGRRVLKRKIIRRARRDGGVPIERLYLTEITWA